MSSSGVWGPPPPDVDLSETQAGSIVGSVTATMALGVLAVALRLLARFKAGTRLAIDDYCILLALIFAIGTALLCLLSIRSGGAEHLWVVTVPQFTALWQMTYAFVLIYATCVSLTKASILLFYRRVFGVSRPYYACLRLVVGYWVAITIAWLAGCRPASYFWEQFTDPGAEGSCMDTSLFYFVNGICAMLIDIAILLVPIPTVYRLQMPPSQKVAVCAIFLLGAFVCIASVIRIITMDALVKATDFTWAMAQVFIWSCCEPFVGIVCACLPTYSPLFRSWWRAMNTENSGDGTNGSNGFNLNDTKIRMNLYRRQWGKLHGKEESGSREDEIELAGEVIATGPTGSLRTTGSNKELGYLDVDKLV
ncbi:hypothetical protein F4778DRAFT_717585 [Xylariomycetidae sp. FL2044]|nr:hypothetical protein F4778DRAFT_717585 [Xylariomycetidae sp. FL2044]